MTVIRNLRLVDVDQLADECAAQTARFFSRATHDPGCCYELFRRAIVGRNSYAWEKVYRQYSPLVAGWVRRHSWLPASGEDVEYFVNRAFEKMWSAMDGEKFSKFPDLPSLLRYLQMCVNSVIVDCVRSNHLQTLDLEALPRLSRQEQSSIETGVTDQFDRCLLWQSVVALMQDERELVVLRFSFLHDLKPGQIYAACPGRFENVGEVYRVKRNLLNRLRRSPILQQFLHHW